MNNIKKMIDVDAAMTAAFYDPHLTDSEAKVIREFLDRQETVDAKEVVRGQWKKDGTCSNCKGLNPTYRANKWSAEFPDFPGNFDYLNYCPNCGAKMVGETMEVKKRLVELLSENFVDFCNVDIIAGNCKIRAITFKAEEFADCLIANGVTIPAHTEKGKGNG